MKANEVPEFGSRNLSGEVLRGLLRPENEAAEAWSAGDLRGMLEQLLAARLSTEAAALAVCSGVAREVVDGVLKKCGDPTFLAVLGGAGGAGGAELLRFLKDYAKGAQDVQCLPREVARVLYVATVARAQRGGTGAISSMSAVDVAREAGRCLTLGWLPEVVRVLLGEAAGGGR